MGLVVKFEFGEYGPCNCVSCESQFATGHRYSYERGGEFGHWQYCGSGYLAQFVDHELIAIDEIIGHIGEAEGFIEEILEGGGEVDPPE